jgi:polar amino acid transport system substrate-binding protein
MERSGRMGHRGARRLALLAAGATLVAGIAGCGGGGSGSGSAKASVTLGPAQVAAQQGLKKYGWAPLDGAVPNMACTDDSYARAVKNGVTYGTYDLHPYSYLDPASKSMKGNEWDILVAALNYAGITKVRQQFAPFDSLIPAITAGRIDLMPGHETPERLKVIKFSAPVYWYGPAIAVKKGNPAHIRSYADLLRKGVTVGVVSGSSAEIYMHEKKGKAIPYKDQNTEFASLAAGRETAILDDAPPIAEYMGSKPSSGIELLADVQLDASTLATLGYGYFRFGINKNACSLNAALSRGLAEIRANGVLKEILKRDGLGQAAAVSIPGTE